MSRKHDKIDVAIYEFTSSHMAWMFVHKCRANHLCAERPNASIDWERHTVQVLIPNNRARMFADLCAKGAPVVDYKFKAADMPTISGRW